MRHLGARFAAPHPGNIDADPTSAAIATPST
jgi:hypothetical protein